MNLVQNRHYSWNESSSETLLFICRRVFLLSFRWTHVFHETSLAVRSKERGLYREEKSFHHVAMVAKFLDDNKPIKSLKSLFALFQSSPILFTFIKFGKSWRNFLWDRIYRYLSLEKESDNFCVVFTYSIKQAREIRKFHVVVVQTQHKKCSK